MSRVHLILMAVKWQIESSAALWILGLISYLLCSNMIKVMENVLNVIGWYRYKVDYIKFLCIWFLNYQMRQEEEKIHLYVIYCIYAICFPLLSITYPCCGVTPCAFPVPFTTQFKSLLLYFHFLGLTKLRILNIFFTFSMSWNAEGKKFQICMKCSIFHTDVLNWEKKYSATFALKRNFHNIN